MVGVAWREPGADRAGGGSIVAMALWGAAGSGAGGGTAGDAACKDSVIDDAGEDGPQRRAPHSAADAAGLFPLGTLQVDGRPGSARPADGAQAGAIEAVRRRDEPARHSARLRAQSWANHVAELCSTINHL